jgi:hypothetical protein
VRVRVTAIHPTTGRAIGHRSAKAFAYRRDSAVYLLREPDAAALAIMPADNGDGTAEDGLIGREVTP